MHPILQAHIKEIQLLCSLYSVKRLHAFGSVTQAAFSATSDIDLLISFLPMSHGDYADAYFSLADQLEALFHRPVELVTENSLHNPYFIASVNQSKVLLYESSAQKVSV